MEIIEILKSLSEINRLRILNLVKEKELCVCHLQSVLELSQSNISKHILNLKNSDLIVVRKDSQYSYIKINEEKIKKISFVSELINNSLEFEIFKKDLLNLSKFDYSSCCK